MSKFELLEYLAKAEAADATEVASALSISYPVAAIGLLRLVRQGLVTRYVDPNRANFWYRLSKRGRRRLAYFRDTQ